MACQKASFSVKMLTTDDTPKVQQFLKKSFYRDEPLNICVKLWERENTIKALEKYSTLPMQYNCSFMAINEKGELIGVCLNKIRKKADKERVVFEDAVFSKIIGIMMKAEEGCKIFENFTDVNSYMQYDILSVDTTVRGQGIAKKMMDASRDFAAQSGIKLMRIDCSSLYSAKAAERLGFTKIYGLKYQDYKIDGEPVFKPDPPHTEFAVYIKRLDG